MQIQRLDFPFDFSFDTAINHLSKMHQKYLFPTRKNVESDKWNQVYSHAIYLKPLITTNSKIELTAYLSM